MVEIPLLQDIVVIFGASMVVLFIAHRLKIPTIVGFLVTGALIGPYGFGLVHSEHEVEMLAEIGVILLLFTIGMEFSLRELMRERKAVLLGGALQVGVTSAVIFGLVHLLDLSGNEALFAGFLVALSSTAIVLKSIQERAEINTPHGRTILAILIFQDMIIVPMMIFAPIMADSGGDLGGSLTTLLVKAVVMVLLVFVAARWVVPNLLYQVTRTRSREMFLLVVVVIGIAVAWLTSQMGLSLGLGAFLAGLVISESEYSHQALEGVLPFRDVFNSFFFVSVGMLFNTGFLLESPATIIVAAVVVLVLKTIIAGGVGLILGMSIRTALLVGLGLAQVGEFSFILSKVGLSYNLIDGDLYQQFIGISVITMAATPFIIKAAPLIADRVLELPLPERLRVGTAPGVQTTEKTESLNDHLIIVGYGVNGRNLARAARRSGIPFCILETNPETVKRERENGEPIEYGDATAAAVLHHAGVRNARIIVVAISDPTATRAIARLARELNPSLHIVVRTRFVAEVKPLYDLGADEVIPEEFETSVEIFTRVLSKYLVPRDEIERFIADVRAGSYKMLRSVSRPGPVVTDLAISIPDAQVSAIHVEAPSALIGKTLAETKLRERCGVTVLAVRRGEKTITNPGAAIEIRKDDVLYVLGTASEICEADLVVREA